MANIDNEQPTVMANIDNELLEQFFRPARQMQVEDNGFTERVMRHLPDRAICLSRWWTATCIALGIVLFVVFRGWQPLLVSILSLTHDLASSVHPIPFFMTLGVLSCLAVLGTVRQMEQFNSFSY